MPLVPSVSNGGDDGLTFMCGVSTPEQLVFMSRGLLVGGTLLDLRHCVPSVRCKQLQRDGAVVLTSSPGMPGYVYVKMKPW